MRAVLTVLMLGTSAMAMVPQRAARQDTPPELPVIEEPDLPEDTAIGDPDPSGGDPALDDKTPLPVLPGAGAEDTEPEPDTVWVEAVDGNWNDYTKWKGDAPCNDDVALLETYLDTDGNTIEYTVSITTEVHPVDTIILGPGSSIEMPPGSTFDFEAGEDEVPCLGITATPTVSPTAAPTTDSPTFSPTFAPSLSPTVAPRDGFANILVGLNAPLPDLYRDLSTADKEEFQQKLLAFVFADQRRERRALSQTDDLVSNQIVEEDGVLKLKLAFKSGTSDREIRKLISSYNARLGDFTWRGEAVLLDAAAPGIVQVKTSSAGNIESLEEVESFEALATVAPSVLDTVQGAEEQIAILESTIATIEEAKNDAATDTALAEDALFDLNLKLAAAQDALKVAKERVADCTESSCLELPQLTAEETYAEGVEDRIKTEQIKASQVLTVAQQNQAAINANLLEFKAQEAKATNTLCDAGSKTDGCDEAKELAEQLNAEAVAANALLAQQIADLQAQLEELNACLTSASNGGRGCGGTVNDITATAGQSRDERKAAEETSGGGGGLPLIPIAAAGAVIVILLVVLIAKGGGGSSNSDREVRTFDNPMYDQGGVQSFSAPDSFAAGNNNGYLDVAADPDDGDGLYDEPAFVGDTDAAVANAEFADAPGEELYDEPEIGMAVDEAAPTDEMYAEPEDEMYADGDDEEGEDE